MQPVQEDVTKYICSFLDQSGTHYEKKVEPQPYGEVIRLEIQDVNDHCVTLVYPKGNIVNQAKLQSKLKDKMEHLKTSIEQNGLHPDALPFEIESFPEKLSESIPNIDAVIVRYIEEAICCYKAKGYLATAFLVGAASEKAIWLLIDSYIEAITDPGNKASIRNRVNNKFVSRAYDEFKNSFRACKSKPTDPALNDWEVMVDAMFQFFRITRNDVGHPAIVPNVDPGVILASMGLFYRYIHTIYRLIDHFSNNPVIV
jgi:hypothetical protein